MQIESEIVHILLPKTERNWTFIQQMHRLIQNVDAGRAPQR